MRKNAVRVAGFILIAASVWYVGHNLYRNRGQMPVIDLRLVAGMTVLSVAYFVGNIGRAVNWKIILEILTGRTLRFRSFLGIYLKTEIVKYVPSNIMHFAGRHLLCRENGVSHRAALGSNIADMAFILAAAALATVPSFFVASEFPVYAVVSRVRDHSLPVVIAAGCFILAMAVVIWIKRRLVRRFLRVGIVSRAFAVLSLDTAIVILNGLIFFSAIVMFSAQSHAGTPWWMVCSLYALCWMAGFVVPGSPGGLGVREALIVLVFGGVYPDAAALAILMRVVSIAGDALALLAGCGMR
ncbi:MAG TPA: lysylphosphatidylglycerol synthase domain-containing protein [Spirochaetota bacterium]|nr:lysylphosphatidylglycerol synthase domain-containing protein [Spirochaetota bacterium]